jgi:hypothetical protein
MRSTAMVAGASPVTARADLGLGLSGRLGLGVGGREGGSGRLYRWKRGEQGKIPCECESMGAAFFRESPLDSSKIRDVVTFSSSL